MSLDNVKAAVIGQAKAEADKLLQEANAVVERMLADSRAADERTAADAVRDAKLRLERDTVRQLESIQHDNRIEILSAKNKAIDEVFKRVNDKLISLSDADYIGLVSKWLGALPQDGGGQLHVNPADVAKFESVLGSLNSGRSESGKFTGVTADAAVRNGAVVVGAYYTVDCTLATRLNEMRETAAGELAKVLFGA